MRRFLNVPQAGPREPVYRGALDAALTYAGAKYLSLSPELARPPGFIVATIVNFLLNRAITFRHSEAPLFRAFIRYCVVACAKTNISIENIRKMRANK